MKSILFFPAIFAVFCSSFGFAVGNALNQEDLQGLFEFSADDKYICLNGEINFLADNKCTVRSARASGILSVRLKPLMISAQTQRLCRSSDLSAYKTAHGLEHIFESFKSH